LEEKARPGWIHPGGDGADLGQRAFFEQAPDGLSRCPALLERAGGAAVVAADEGQHQVLDAEVGVAPRDRLAQRLSDNSAAIANATQSADISQAN
jgi:hypothetical protein